MIYYENGPAMVFARFRAWAARFDNPGHLNDMLSCFKCLSVWVALPAAFVVAESLGWFLAYWLALSGGAIIIDDIVGKLEE